MKQNSKVYVTGNDDTYNVKSTKHTITISDKDDDKVYEINDQLPSTDHNDEHGKEETYLPSRFERIVNYLLCRPDLAKRKLKAKPVTLTGLFRYANRFDIFLICIGTFCAVISGIGQPVMAIVTGTASNVLLTESPDSEAFRRGTSLCIYLYFSIGIVVLSMNYVQFICFQSTCSRLITRLRQHYIRSILRQNSEWFDHNQSGELTTRLNDNIERIREGIGDKLGLLIRGFSMFITSIIIAFCFQWRLALVMFPVAPISTFLMAQMAQQMGATTKKELDDIGKAGAVAEESILGVRTVQAFNGQEEMVERYKNHLSKGKKYGITKNYWSGFLGGSFFLVLIVFLGGGLLYGGHLLRIGVFDEPGQIFIVVMAILMGSYFLGVISPHLMVLLNARVAAGTIYQTIDRKPEIDVFSKSGFSPSDVKGRVVFKDVHFRYPSRKTVKVLNGLSLVVEPGQTVALVGHSGCGKSTSISLLTRLYEVESGSVTIDGYDVREVNIKWLRSMIGVVQQEPILFNGTIIENLKVGDPNASFQQMTEVCRMANAHDFISKLPQGYETKIGDGGVQLSGGQKQRIAIARALIRNPKILLLDEATSALDTKSEAVVQKALENASVGRTTIVIAHRLSTVRNADQIIVFDKGTIVEQGSHKELIVYGGFYGQLVKAQQFQQTDDEREEGTENLKDIIIHDTLEDVIEEDVEMTAGDSVRRRTHSSVAKSSFVRGTEAFIRASSNDISLRYTDHRLSVTVTDSFVTETNAFVEAAEIEMAEQEKSSAGLITIYRNAHGNYTAMAFGILIGAICGLHLPTMSLLFTYVFRIYQKFVENSNNDIANAESGDTMINELCILMAIYCGVGVAILLTQFISTALFGMVSENVVMSFRISAFRNILFQDAAYFDNPSHAPGNLITRLASDAPNVKAALDSRMLQVIFGASGFLASVVIGFVYSWQVALVGSTFSLLLGALQICVSRWVYRRNLQLLEEDDASRLAVEIIEGVKTIQLLTREEEFYRKYANASLAHQKAELRKIWIEAKNFALSQSYQYFMNALAFATGTQMIKMQWEKFRDSMYTANIFNAITAQLMGAIGVMHSAVYFPEFIKAQSSAKLLFAMIERKPKTGNLHEGDKVSILGNVSFDKVSFFYPQKPKQPVMNGLQFTISSGQTVALVGPSGCGKSTAISLLERFYDPNDGFVRFDGTDLRKLNLYHLRSQMALVGQEPRLFAGSIRENVCLGLKESVSVEKIFEALQLANAKSFVDALPLGLETDVGEKGAKLSGGQKQRIAIARAVIRDPKILLLDEATSALDSESERAVQEALDQARKGRTCITIAHRLSSIQNSDLIIYIENGHVQEIGTHQSLIASRGHYFDLIQQQDLA